MRKKTNKSRLMLALWLGIAWPALAGGPFVINGKLAGVEDGAVVRLFRPDGSMGAAVAADTLRNGRFMLCGEGRTRRCRCDGMSAG